jgi:hypothetical protein
MRPSTTCCGISLKPFPADASRNTSRTRASLRWSRPAGGTARLKVQAAEDAWNTRDPERVALAYMPDSEWRNRVEFLRYHPIQHQT